MNPIEENIMEILFSFAIILIGIFTIIGIKFFWEVHQYSNEKAKQLKALEKYLCGSGPLITNNHLYAMFYDEKEKS